MQSSFSEVRRFSLKHKKKTIALAALVIVALGATAVAFRPRSRPYRIGFANFPPYMVVNSDGSPGGFAVDLIGEAARRQHITLQWVATPRGPEPALSEGVVE